MTSKEFLRQAETAMKKKRLYESEVRRIRAEITSLSGVDYSAPRVQTSNKADIADRVARLEEAENRNKVAYIDATNTVDEVVAVIKQVKNATLCLLLYHRYIQLLTWDEVADKLHHSVRVIHRSLHGQALREVDKIRTKKVVTKSH